MWSSRFTAALHRPGVGWAAGVLAALLLVTAAAWRVTQSSVNAQAQTQFVFTAAELADAVGDRLHDYEQVLWGAASMLAASPELSQEQWRAYADRLRVPERMPGMRGVGFARYLRPEDVPVHLREMQVQGHPYYAINPPGERAEYAANMFLATPGNQRAFGFDMLTEPLRRAAAERARDTGRAALSSKLILIQEDVADTPNGFLMYLPVYRIGAATGTPEQRRAALAGFVYSPFGATELIAGSLRQRDFDIAMEIYDGEQVSEPALLYRSEPGTAPVAGRHVHQTTLIMADRPWTFRFAALASYVAGVDQSRPFIVLVAGVLISLLGAAAAGALAANRAQAAAANQRLRADVARREQIEVQLSQSEAKFRLLFDNNPQPMWAFDRVTLRFVEVNNTAIVRYGYSREEFLAMRVTDIRPAEDVPMFVANLAASPTGYRRMGRYRHKLRDGRIIDVDVNAHEIELSGRPLTLVLAQDITERALAEEALGRSQARFQAIMDNAPLMVSLKGLDGRYSFANRRFCEHYRMAPEQIAGRTAAEVLPAARAIQDAAADDAVRRRRRPVQYEHAEPGNDRPRVTLGVHFPVPGAAGAVDAIGAITADITDMKWTEDQLRQAQKMEAVGHLTGGVAHDFNNLLTVIIGNAELMQDRVMPESVLSGLVDTIQSAADRGAELTRRLLAFSRRQALRPSAVDLNELVRGMDGLLRRTLGEDIEIRTALSADLWPATVDASQVENALLNLAVNARDAMPGGGKLLIETGNLVLDDEATATYRFGVAVGPYVMLAVTDTGVGMSADVVERAFEPFFTTKEVGKGSGLGLSMVYGFVKQSGGFVKIYSEVGQGTAVRLYLPRAALGDAAVAAEAPAAPGGRESILVVEDDDQVRGYVVRRLTSLGYAVRQAADAAAALDDLTRGGAVDLLFTDVILPNGVNGRQLADQARERFPTLKVLFTSGYTEDAIVHQGRLDPGVALLHKPYRKEALAQKIREVLDGA